MFAVYSLTAARRVTKPDIAQLLGTVLDATNDSSAIQFAVEISDEIYFIIFRATI